MATMEHHCRSCDETWFDNDPKGQCPKCGSDDVQDFWDEQLTYYGED